MIDGNPVIFLHYINIDQLSTSAILALITKIVYAMIYYMYMWYIMGGIMTITATELRKNLFALMDRCLEKGEVLDIRRKNGVVRLSPLSRRLKVSELPDRPGMLKDSETLDRFSPTQWSGHDIP